MFAVAIGLLPFVVGVSVEPKSDTIILIPAAAYSAFTLERWASVNWAHSAAYVGLHQIRDVKWVQPLTLSNGPFVKRKDKALEESQIR